MKYKVITANEVKATVKANIEDPLIPGLVLEALKKFEGKTITKRAASAVEKVLPGYTVSYKAEPGYWISLSVWGKNIPYNERYTFDLVHVPWNGTPSDATPFSVEKFTEENSGRYYKYAAERNSKRLTALGSASVDAITAALNKVSKARAALAAATNEAEALLSDVPERYALLALAE